MADHRLWRGNAHMAVTYLLFSIKLRKFYVGSSREDSVSGRLCHHNEGSVRSTKAGRPWIVVEVEKFANYTEARRRELFLKSGVGRQEIYKKFSELKRHDFSAGRRVRIAV